ncbi:2OG-Fe(II) oxygenase superfamily protein [Xylariales sp. PMI_506]|nr:2OG-Fe(II) oxygenase superfamily protein [Xylariales sp. PMI_506]
MKELPIQPSGLFWQDDFITPEHEERLVHIFLHELEWPERSGRLSLHYGYTFDYKTFGVDPNIPFKDFPEWLQPLIPTCEGRPPEQVCLQHYPPGAGIPPHVDTHSAYDQLYALSLGSPVMMQFQREGRERVEVDLAPRSMLQMSGDARLHWTHGIKKRKTDTLPDGTVRLRRDRWSITYRWVRLPAPVCECGDEKLCDTAQSRAGIEREYRWKKGDATATDVIASTTPVAEKRGTQQQQQQAQETSRQEEAHP